MGPVRKRGRARSSPATGSDRCDMKHLLLPVLFALSASAGAAQAQAFNYGDAAPAYGAPAYGAPARPVAQARSQANLGGGFIEFLMTGGQMAEPAPAAAVPRYRMRNAQAGAYAYGQAAAAPVPQAQRYAYAMPPSAAPAMAPRRQFDMRFAPQEVAYDGSHKPGHHRHRHRRSAFSISSRPDGKAMRYGVGVGREGFEWRGTRTIERKAEWPDWRPPAEMLKRRPDLPSFMAGGPDNPLGARAMYLGRDALPHPWFERAADRSATPSRLAASACATRTSSTSMIGSRSAPRSSCCRPAPCRTALATVHACDAVRRSPQSSSPSTRTTSPSSRRISRMPRCKAENVVFLPKRAALRAGRRPFRLVRRPARRHCAGGRPACISSASSPSATAHFDQRRDTEPAPSSPSGSRRRVLPPGRSRCASPTARRCGSRSSAWRRR